MRHEDHLARRLDAGPDLLEWRRRQPVLEALKGFCRVRPDEIGPRGERLAELDRRRADLLQRRGIVDRLRHAQAKARHPDQPAHVGRGQGIALDPSRMA